MSWLNQRRLEEATLRYFLVGWSAGIRVGEVYLPRGVVLPCMQGDTLWYIKIALLPGQAVRCEGCGKMTAVRQPCPGCARLNKYRGVKGNRGEALYNSDELLLNFGGAARRPTLFVEGEFDCMSAWQVLRDEVAVVTLGSAGGRIDLATWGGLLLRAGRIYSLYDNDPAGEQGRRIVHELSAGSCIDLRLPDGVKDVNEFIMRGGDLRAWFIQARQTSEVFETSEVYKR